MRGCTPHARSMLGGESAALSRTVQRFRIARTNSCAKRKAPRGLVRQPCALHRAFCTGRLPSPLRSPSCCRRRLSAAWLPVSCPWEAPDAPATLCLQRAPGRHFTACRGDYHPGCLCKGVWQTAGCTAWRLGTVLSPSVPANTTCGSAGAAASAANVTMCK